MIRCEKCGWSRSVRTKECKCGIPEDTSLMKSFEDFIALKEHAQDYIDTYTNEEIAQLVREGVLTMEEVEAGLRRRKYAG